MTAEETSSSPLSQLLGSPQKSADLSILDKIGERAGRGLRQIVGNFGIAPPEMGPAEIRVEAFDQWREKLPPISGICRIAMAPFKAGVVMVIPARLVAQMVDGFYGGSGDVRFDRTSFTGAEDRILNRVGNQMAEILSAAWADITPVTASLFATATDDEIPLFSANEQLAVQSIALDGPMFAGMTVEFLYPVAGVRGLRPIAGVGSVEPEQTDAIWQDKLIDAVLQVRFPLRTIFARAELPLSDLLNLQPGDVIPICLPNRVPVTVGERRFAEGIVGEANGRASIRIEAMQKGPCDND